MLTSPHTSTTITNIEQFWTQLYDWHMRDGSGGVVNGLEALAVLWKAATAGDPYDLVLLDMEMSGMDGLTFARQVKADPTTASTHLILLTSVCGRLDPAEIREAGIAAHLIKPVKMKHLRRTILVLCCIVSLREPSQSFESKPSS